jgi:hypothetical protein
MDKISYLIRVNPFRGRMGPVGTFLFWPNYCPSRRLFLQTNSVFNKEMFITIFHAISNRCQMKNFFQKARIWNPNDIVFIQGFIAACDIHFSFLPCLCYFTNIGGLFWWVLLRLKSIRYKSSFLFRSLYIRFYKVSVNMFTWTNQYISALLGL